jgi:hypothetical protein
MRDHVRDGDVGDHSNNFSLHVQCTYSSHGRPDGCSGRMRAPIFLWLFLSVMVIYILNLIDGDGYYN